VRPPPYNVNVQRSLAAILAIGALCWSAILFVAPFALTSGSPRLAAAAAALYGGAGLICHQRAERSFYVAGVQQPVCARCAGLYGSAAAGSLAAAAPTALTVVLELAGLAHPSNTVRAMCALPFGAAAAWVVIQSLRAEAAEARRFGQARQATRWDAL